jgi:hypothetical protein
MNCWLEQCTERGVARNRAERLRQVVQVDVPNQKAETRIPNQTASPKRRIHHPAGMFRCRLPFDSDFGFLISGF